MADNTETKKSYVREDFRRVVSDFSAMISLRRQLAEHELRSDLVISKRCGVVGAIGILLFLSGLPIFAVLVGSWLDRRLLGADAFPWISLVMAFALCGVGLAIGFTAWRSFQSKLNGFQASIGELQEDLVWLREFAGADDDEHRADAT